GQEFWELDVGTMDGGLGAGFHKKLAAVGPYLFVLPTWDFQSTSGEAIHMLHASGPEGAWFVIFAPTAVNDVYVVNNELVAVWGGDGDDAGDVSRMIVDPYQGATGGSGGWRPTMRLTLPPLATKPGSKTHWHRLGIVASGSSRVKLPKSPEQGHPWVPPDEDPPEPEPEPDPEYLPRAWVTDVRFWSRSSERETGVLGPYRSRSQPDVELADIDVPIGDGVENIVFPIGLST